MQTLPKNQTSRWVGRYSSRLYARSALRRSLARQGGSEIFFDLLLFDSRRGVVKMESGIQKRPAGIASVLLDIYRRDNTEFM